MTDFHPVCERTACYGCTKLCLNDGTSAYRFRLFAFAAVQEISWLVCEVLGGGGAQIFIICGAWAA